VKSERRCVVALLVDVFLENYKFLAVFKWWCLRILKCFSEGRVNVPTLFLKVGHLDHINKILLSWQHRSCFLLWYGKLLRVKIRLMCLPHCDKTYLIYGTQHEQIGNSVQVYNFHVTNWRVPLQNKMWEILIIIENFIWLDFQSSRKSTFYIFIYRN